MFIRMDKKELLDAVTPALCAVSSKGTLPALECLYFSADEKEGKVTVLAFDNSKGVKTTFSASVLAPGGILLPGQKLVSFIRSLPDGEVSISSDDKFLTTISCRKSKLEIAGMSEANFPALPELRGDKSFIVKQSVLKKQLGAVLFSVQTKDLKPSLTGVLFELKKNLLTLVSCDGYRISKTTQECENELEEKFIVPGRTLNELVRLLADDEEELKIIFTRRHIIFEFEDLIFFSRLIEEEFIDYKKSLPQVFSCTMLFDPIEAEAGVERCALVIDDNARSPLSITIAEDVVYLKSQTANGKVEEEFSADVQGDGLTIGFNNRYFLEALRGALLFTEEKVFAEFVNPMSGAVIRPTEGEEFYYLLLPVRMQ